MEDRGGHKTLLASRTPTANPATCSGPARLAQQCVSGFEWHFCLFCTLPRRYCHLDMQTCPQPHGSAISLAQPSPPLPVISHLDHLSPGLPKPGQDWTSPQGNPLKAPIATGMTCITSITMTRPSWVSLCPLSLFPLFPSQDLCTCYFLCLELSFQGHCLLIVQVLDQT